MKIITNLFKINKRIFFWGLYDFANSLIIANLTLYFSQWIIVDNHTEDIWYSLVLALSTILLIVTAPFLGTYSDRTKKRIKIINPLSITIAVCTILLGFFGASTLPITSKVFITLFLFFVIQYAYQLSLIFYDTLLAKLTTPDQYGKISGFGDGMGNLGWIAGLFFTIPFINGKITLFGIPGKIQAFIPTGIGFILLALPMMISFKDRQLKPDTKIPYNYQETLNSLKKLLKNRNILWFLIAFYFISDAILTIQTFFPIYFQQVLKFSDFQKILATVIVLVFVIIGGVTLGKFSDKVGYKKLLMLSTLILIILFLIFPLIKTPLIVWFLLPIIGLFWGAFYSISRAFLTLFAPSGKRSEFFSLYTIFRRFASVVGPILWGLSVLVFSSFGSDKYRIAIYPLIIFMALGLLLLNKISESK